MMATQYESALLGAITPEMTAAAAHDGVAPELIRAGLAAGTIVLPKNRNRTLGSPRAIGAGLHTKVNVNIGSSPDLADSDQELRKLEVSLKYGTDSVMDLSLGTRINQIRRQLLARCPVMFGTVPIYQVCFEMSLQKRDVREMTIDDYLKVVESQALEGVDFMTIHAGITRRSAEPAELRRRLLGVVSRGGSILVHWMKHNGRENPLYERFDDILEICRRHDVTVSLGDGLRPGATADATDRSQLAELAELGELVLRCRAAGVQVMVEGPGHVPLDQVEANVKLEKRLCHGAPFYVLGPLTVDFAPGYDHIAGAIGGAVAAMHGADFLCYVTPAEHIKLPDVEDVKQGLIASKIAGYAADLAKGFADVKKRTDDMSVARRKLDWTGQAKYCVDPDLLERKRKEGNPHDTDYCSMCGEFCAIKRNNELHE
jgi:phosphomethylpyrimidine synthase